MIDLHILRKEPDKIKKQILKKEPTFNVDKLITLDEQVREITAQIEDLRKKRNEISRQREQGVTSEEREESIKIGKQIKTKEKELETKIHDFNAIALSCPNIVQDDVPLGDKENNKVVTEVGSKQKFDFEPKNHLELNEKNGWFDLKSATKMSGANFVIYKSAGTKVLYALTNLMIKNNVKYGFEPIMLPYLVNEQVLVNSGNLPKFKDDFYEINEDELCLIPTAEVNLTSLHADQIFDEKELPKKYTSWTSCFRKEAGGYGAGERGLIRIHQFEKVEIYTICKPENFQKEFERMLSCAQDLLKELGIHYRVSLLAAQDTSFSASKTYDIEVWLPGQDEFYEISSCSNCTDFQARRAKIRYKNSSSKPNLVYTLNGSSLSLPRLMVAIMEQFQQEDGSIKLPKKLQDAVDSMW
jgi:seryl-tRNA synthetase